MSPDLDLIFKGSCVLVITLPSSSVNFSHLIKIFSEATETIETKVPRIDHLKVLYKAVGFLCQSEIQDGCSDID